MHRQFIGIASRTGKLSAVPPCPSFGQIRNVRQGFFDAEKLQNLIEVLPAPLGDLTRFAAITGWRKQEILTLEWRHVDFEAGEVRLFSGETKADRGRKFPFSASPALGEVLASARRRTSEQEKTQGKLITWVFHRSGKPLKDFEFARKTACRKVGCEGGFFHDLRRTGVRNPFRAGVDRHVAKKLTGHLTDAVFERYDIMLTKDLEAAVVMLGERSGDNRVTIPYQEPGRSSAEDV
jgi:integrase